MLTRRDIYKRIDEIVERFYLGFLFELVGDEFFTDEQKRKIEGLGLIIGHKPLIELLYTLIRNRPTQGYAQDFSLNSLLEDVARSGILPIINTTQQTTLDNGKLAMIQALETSKTELKKQITQKVIEANKQYNNETTVHRYTSVPVEQAKATRHIGTLLAGIGALAIATNRAFQRTFTTELTSFINDSTVDKVAEAALIDGKLPQATEVYKTVINDGSLCQWCRKFYLKGGEPIIFKLVDLEANGSNYGKPKSQWKPTIGPTHPRCRCQLHIKR